MAARKDFSALAIGFDERVKPGRGGPAIDARSTRTWIETLPRADNARTAGQLLTHLRALNRLRVAPGARGECLELLRKVLFDAELVLERQLTSASFPLNEQKRRIGDLLVDNHLELANGYRAVVYDYCGLSGKPPMLRGKTVATAIQRAVHHLGCCLTRNYQMYLAARPGIWLAINTLTLVAVSASLARRGVLDELRGGKTSPQSVFFQSLLLALSNPYRMTQANIVEVNAAAAVLAHWCEMRPGQPDDGQVAVFLEADRGPGYFFADTTQAQADTLWQFDTAALQTQLQQALQESEALPRATLHGRGDVTGNIDRDLLERLMLAWGVSAGRGHARLSAEHQLDASVGLSSAHSLSASGDDFETFLGLVMRSTVTTLGDEHGGVWSGSHDAPVPAILKSRVLDQSLGGYRVAWEASESLRARVGELVAIVPHGDESAEPSEWMLCVIRWLLSRGDGYIEAGIELLARRYQPVAVRVMSRGGRSKPPQRGLLLEPLNRDLGTGRTLVVPSLVDLSQGEVQVARPPDLNALQLAPELDTLTDVSVIEDTGAFKLLRFSVEGSSADAETEDELTDEPDAESST